MKHVQFVQFFLCRFNISMFLEFSNVNASNWVVFIMSRYICCNFVTVILVRRLNLLRTITCVTAFFFLSNVQSLLFSHRIDRSYKLCRLNNHISVIETIQYSYGKEAQIRSVQMLHHWRLWEKFVSNHLLFLSHFK